MSTVMSDDLALRVAMASKAIPELALQDFVNLLVKQCGEPLSEKKFRALSPKILRELLQNPTLNIDRSHINQVHAILSSAQLSPMQAPKLPESRLCFTGPVVTLAVSSNNMEQIDGHFGSCLRFLIYQVSAAGYQLVEVRPVAENLTGDARTSYLIELINDCQLLATLSIGGPAAARVSRADILPLKQMTPQASELILDRLQIVMLAPPRWLEKLLERQGVLSIEQQQECLCPA
ncbi:dinitrogenase iron-molybdenum cofactor biosynthesis protein [Agarivorans sp. TSD2052]|uniref:dinitrogenase iron-molybdenum cofactor biosynthesis protein n=1 Tax=Agarivorans sp. TSD2052 TaxID=2937286 RepID=UPI0020106EE6|nr:dinitrogenase iron-molybdenum cofactor biosynthesis protein [Agarivorans sp. TSD2052]UPW20325.1 dinitrogenase iron-molybdenum cofactor biosynthesis protein [Agarivorans sp. TSD2052]